MAPFPEEIDVFSGPHLEMKYLVDCYSEMLLCTDFSDVAATKTLLQSLHSTFCVFRSHEQIENEFIMYRLRTRLEMLDVVDPHESVICNCHSDNRLTEMLELVADGLQDSLATSLPAEQLCYERRLKKALSDFTCSFLPHMKEEEEVFQPLLIKYFEYDELLSLKEAVTEQHQRLGSAKEKFCMEAREVDLIGFHLSKESDLDMVAIGPQILDYLPPELILKVFSYLRPPDLGHCAQVCSKWNALIYQPSLWRFVAPAHWARGIWQQPYDTYNPEDDPCYASLRCRKCAACHIENRRFPIDGDCDKDESTTPYMPEKEYEEEEESRSRFQALRISNTKLECPILKKEILILDALQQFVLPRVGINVHHLSLAACGSLDGKQLAAMLLQCPNLNHLDLSYTNMDDYNTKQLVAAFEKSDTVDRPRPEHLDLSGCSFLTDESLKRLVACFVAPSKLSNLNLSGCHLITDKGIRFLFIESAPYGMSVLNSLNLSGCWNLSGIVLSECVRSCPNMNPENLYYCDHIINGPHPEIANGCQNLECPFRRCCCT